MPRKGRDKGKPNKGKDAEGKGKDHGRDGKGVNLWAATDRAFEHLWVEEWQLTVSKNLATLLRHSMDTDDCGWVMVPEVLRRINAMYNVPRNCPDPEQFRTRQIDKNVLFDVIKLDQEHQKGKTRFEMSGGRIRAINGHTRGLVTEKAYDKVRNDLCIRGVFHATSAEAWRHICTQGIILGYGGDEAREKGKGKGKGENCARRGRDFIHLAKFGFHGQDPRCGARREARMLVFIDAEKAMADGMRFCRSDVNGVILTKGIPIGNDSYGIPPRHFLAVVDKEEPAFARLLRENRQGVANMIAKFYERVPKKYLPSRVDATLGSNAAAAPSAAVRHGYACATREPDSEDLLRAQSGAPSGQPSQSADTQPWRFQRPSSGQIADLGPRASRVTPPTPLSRRRSSGRSGSWEDPDPEPQWDAECPEPATGAGEVWDVPDAPEEFWLPVLPPEAQDVERRDSPAPWDAFQLPEGQVAPPHFFDTRSEDLANEADAEARQSVEEPEDEEANADESDDVNLDSSPSPFPADTEPRGADEPPLPHRHPRPPLPPAPPAPAATAASANAAASTSDDVDDMDAEGMRRRLNATHKALVDMWQNNVETFSDCVREAQKPKKPPCVQDVVAAAEQALFDMTLMARAAAVEGTNYVLAAAAYNAAWDCFHSELLKLLKLCPEQGELTEEVLPEAAELFCDAWCRLSDIQEHEGTLISAFLTAATIVLEMFEEYLKDATTPDKPNIVSTMRCYMQAKHLEVRGVMNEGVVEEHNARFILAANSYVQGNGAKTLNQRQDAALAGSGYSGIRAWRCAADTPAKALSTLISVLVAFSRK